MQHKPLVSILLLSMNHEDYISQCVKSIAEQTYKNIEIIYLDNASKDNTFITGKALMEQFSLPYKAFYNAESKGISENLNILINESSGQFILPLSTDDWWMPDNIQAKLTFLEENPECGMVYSDGYNYYKDGKKHLFSQNDSFFSGEILEDLLRYNFIKAPSVMLRMDVLDEVGLYDENLLIEDWDLWIRIAEKYPIGLIRNPLIYYRYGHGGNVSSKQAFIVNAVNQMIEKYKLKYPKQMKLLARKNILREANYRAFTHFTVNGFAWFLTNIQLTPSYMKTIIKYIFWRKPALPA